MSYIAPTSTATNIIAKVISRIRNSNLPEAVRFGIVEDLSDLEQLIHDQADEIEQMESITPPRRRFPSIQVHVFGR